jgi:hypothetical protein
VCIYMYACSKMHELNRNCILPPSCCIAVCAPMTEGRALYLQRYLRIG